MRTVDCSETERHGFHVFMYEGKQAWCPGR